MSFCTRIVLPVVAVFSLTFLVACGSSTHSPTPPPTGAFSNTSLNGTYTFSVLGQDIDANTNVSPFFEMAGSFTACGCTAGTISGGTVDAVDDTGLGTSLSVNNTSTYKITSDGRGTATLSIATGSGNVDVGLDFVLTSGSHGLVSRFDTGGTGSGTLDSQSSAVTLSTTTPYAFSLSGFNGGPNLLGMVGSFTVTSGGTFAAGGVTDVNSAGTPFTAESLSGNISLGSGTTPGTAQFSSNAGVFNFDVYTIDATHLKLIENDGNNFLVGDVFSQSSAALSQGTYAFAVAGPSTSGVPFAGAGLVSSDGQSQLSNGAEDVNESGTIDGGSNPLTPASFSGSFSNVPSGSGRLQVTLSNFFGGTSFAAYPSSGGILLLEIDSGVNATVTSGVAVAQASTTGLASTTGYGMNMTGTDLGSGLEFDEIAEFTTTSSGMSGLIDTNDFTISNPGTSNLSGSFTAGSNGTGEATFTSGPLLGLLYYSAGSSTLIGLGIDSNDVVLGTIEAQTAPSSAASAEVAQRHLAMVKAVAAAKKRRKR